MFSWRNVLHLHWIKLAHLGRARAHPAVAGKKALKKSGDAGCWTTSSGPTGSVRFTLRC